MQTHSKVFICLLRLIIFYLISIFPSLVKADPAVKNVIFYIGDGMGITQITSSRIYLMGANERFNIEKMPVTGFMATHSIDRLITDSGAGATALATGFKTKNGMIGVKPDSTAVVTIVEAARDKGLSTGLIATSTITHATPASFAAHTASRREQQTIAAQMLDARISLLFGGGKSYFIPQSYPSSQRLDDLDLMQVAESRGYQIIEHRDELKVIRKIPVLGLFSMEAIHGDSTEPSLKEMTSTALEILSQNKKGFFLMVEGSQIDWAGHDNDFQYLVREMIAFDDAVAAGLDFAARDKRTLVLVTADHETGGLVIAGGHLEGKDIQVEWSSTKHSGTLVPLFAAGPQSQLFTGIKDNTEIPVILARILKLKNFPAEFSSLQ
jgi:alkaline phosphatase